MRSWLETISVPQVTAVAVAEGGSIVSSSLDKCARFLPLRSPPLSTIRSLLRLALPEAAGHHWVLLPVRTIRVWDLVSGAPVVLEGHEGPVLCCIVLSSGEILSGSGDTTIRRCHHAFPSLPLPLTLCGSVLLTPAPPLLCRPQRIPCVHTGRVVSLSCCVSAGTSGCSLSSPSFAACFLHATAPLPSPPSPVYHYPPSVTTTAQCHIQSDQQQSVVSCPRARAGLPPVSCRLRRLLVP